MLSLTATALEKVKEIMGERGETESSLRVSVTGGGCSGFQYQMSLEKEANTDDKVFEQDGIKILVDSQSMLYLEGTRVDYINGLHGAGFKFDNTNSRGTCGCGESFHV